MKVQIFDMRDAKEPGDRQMVLRLVMDTDCLLIQSPIYATEDVARDLGAALAAAYGVDLEWYGPPPLKAAIETLQQHASLSRDLEDGFQQLALF